MSSIGETLRRERLRLGLDLDQVAERTKIGTRLLQAMEADQFEKLPGGVFTRSFIKQYARVLGLDEEAIGAEYKTVLQKREEFPPAPQGFRSQTDIPSIVAPENGSRIGNLDPRSRSRLVSAGWVTAAVGVCVAGYFFMNQQRTPDATVSEHPAPTETASNPTENPTPANTAPPVVETRKSASAPAVSSSASTASGAVQVLLKASEDSWLSVTADGRNKFSGVLKANETRQIDANEKVKVIAGNSGGLDISLNGKSIGPIGRAGQKRTVEFTPEGAHVLSQVVPRTPPSSPEPLL